MKTADITTYPIPCNKIPYTDITERVIVKNQTALRIRINCFIGLILNYHPYKSIEAVGKLNKYEVRLMANRNTPLNEIMIYTKTYINGTC